MKKSSELTVIDNENMRGVIAPAAVLSKNTLEDMIDFIEFSSVQSAEDSQQRIEEADKKGSWIVADAVNRHSEAAE